MDFILYYVVPFIVVLGVLIFFHELGHFLAAKVFGVKVLKFSLGFGPKLIGKRIGDTEYLISLVPLGGYVKMLGESGDDEDLPKTREEDAKSFSNKHVLKRMGIVVAGPLFNILLALMIFCSLYAIAGIHILAPEIGDVRKDSPASAAGLMKGDIVLFIDGKSIREWSDIKEGIQERAGEPVEVTVNRSGKTLSVTVVPETSSIKNIFGEEVKSALLGISASGKMEQITLGPVDGILQGFKKTWEITTLTCLTVVKLVQRIIPITTLGGPILIGQMTGELARQSFGYLIPFMAVISINLAILNLLPVPVLDGGFILFLLIELIRGKPMNLKKRDMAQKAGLFLLILLMALVIYNDVLRLIK